MGILVPSLAGYSSSEARAKVVGSISGALGECHLTSFFPFQSTAYAEGIVLPGSMLMIENLPSRVVLMWRT